MIYIPIISLVFSMLGIFATIIVIHKIQIVTVLLEMLVFDIMAVSLLYCMVNLIWEVM